MIDKNFEEIVIEYPPEDLCTYPEYRGKPYFSIKYKEGDDYIIGFGTYNPKVFSRYLRDYFMPSVTPQEPILDKIRNEIERQRKEVSKKHSDNGELQAYFNGWNDGLKDARDTCDEYKAESEVKDGNDD